MRLLAYLYLGAYEVAYKALVPFVGSLALSWLYKHVDS